MSIETYPVAGGCEGVLWIGPHPLGGELLAAAMHALVERGPRLLVSLLTEPEVRELHLADEQRLFEAEGGEFIGFAIPDRGVPDDVQAFAALARRLRGAMECGEDVAMHCWGGIGRSGMLACAVLCEGGASPEQSMRAVAAARGCAVPETQAQRELLRSLYG